MRKRAGRGLILSWTVFSGDAMDCGRNATRAQDRPNILRNSVSDWRARLGSNQQPLPSEGVAEGYGCWFDPAKSRTYLTLSCGMLPRFTAASAAKVQQGCPQSSCTKMSVTHGYTHCSHVTARCSHVTLWNTFSLQRLLPPHSAWRSKQFTTATPTVATCRPASNLVECSGFVRLMLKRGWQTNSVRPKSRLFGSRHRCRAAAGVQPRLSRSLLAARSGKLVNHRCRWTQRQLFRWQCPNRTRSRAGVSESDTLCVSTRLEHVLDYLSAGPCP